MHPAPHDEGRWWCRGPEAGSRGVESRLARRGWRRVRERLLMQFSSTASVPQGEGVGSPVGSIRGIKCVVVVGQGSREVMTRKEERTRKPRSAKVEAQFNHKPTFLGTALTPRDPQLRPSLDLELASCLRHRKTGSLPSCAWLRSLKHHPCQGAWPAGFRGGPQKVS